MDLIAVSRNSGLEFAIRVRGHQVTSDLSAEDGGQDQGLSPAELLAGSLGVCIAIMVQKYCTTCGYDGDVGLSLTLELGDKPKRVARIVVDLELPAGVPEEKRDAIRRVVEHCPVHETLKNPPEMDIDIL